MIGLQPNVKSKEFIMSAIGRKQTLEETIH